MASLAGPGMSSASIPELLSTSRLPSFSDATEHLCEEGLGGEHLGEPLDEWQQEEIGHVRHEFVKHAALTEQRMSAPPGRVGLEMPIVAQLFSGDAEERQQDHCEGIDQPQAVSPVRRADMHRSEPHAEPEILCVRGNRPRSPNAWHRG